jgi:hypothetical protein
MWRNLQFWHWILPLLVITILVRLPLLDGSLWLDEAAQALEVIRPWYQQLDISGDFQPPLYHLILHLWQYGGHQEAWLRVISLASGIGSVILASAIAWHWQGKKAGIWVGLLLATSSLHIFYSQELRPYMLAVLWAMLALYGYYSLVYFQHGKSVLSKHQSLLLFTIVNALGALTSYVYLFFLAGLWIASILTSRRYSWLITRSLLISGVWWLLWFPGLQAQLEVSQALRANVPGWEGVVSLSQLKSIPVTLAKFIVGVLTIDWRWQDIILIITPYIYVFYLVVKYWHSRDRSANGQLYFLIFLLLCSLGLSWLFSFWTPVISPKRILWLLPVLLLLIGQLTRPFPKKIMPLLFFLLGINIWGLCRYWQDPQLQRENWREAVQIIEARYQPNNTIVVFGFDGPFAPWEWYATEDLPTLSTGFKPLASQIQASAALQPAREYENVVLFDYLLDLSDPERFLEQSLSAHGFVPLEVLDYPHLGFIRLYHQQKLFASYE